MTRPFSKSKSFIKNRFVISAIILLVTSLLNGCSSSYFNPDPVAEAASSFKSSKENFYWELNNNYDTCSLLVSLNILAYDVDNPDFRGQFSQNEMKQLLKKVIVRANQERTNSEQFLSFLNDLEENLSEDKAKWNYELDEFQSMFCSESDETSQDKEGMSDSTSKNNKQDRKLTSTREKLNNATGLDFQPHNQMVAGLATLPILGRWETWLAAGTKCFAAQFELPNDASMVEEQWRFMYPTAKIFLIKDLRLVVYDSSVSGSCAIDIQNALGGA